jgi:predicted component of type VI protein secretion system
MREEQVRKFESAFSNRRKLRELEELMNINNDIKNACKELVLKKYKSQKVIKGY